MRITLALLLCLACAAPSSEPSDPTLKAFEGTFVLQSFRGQPLPFLQGDYSLTRYYLVTDTLWADGRGNFALAEVIEVDSIAHPYQTRSESVGRGKYTIRGDTLELQGDCFRECSMPFVGWRTSDPDANLVLAPQFAYDSTTGSFGYIRKFRRVQ